METGGFFAFQIVLAVLAANVVLFLSAAGLAGWWKKQSQENIRKVGEQIASYDNQLGEMINFLDSYSGIQREPFSTPLAELQDNLQDMEARLRRFLTTSQEIETALQTHGENRFLEIINAPAAWFRRWRQTRELARESKEVAEQLAGAQARVQQIYELPWDLAAQCRQVDAELREVIAGAQELNARGARGQTLQTILNQASPWNRAINEIPQEFFQSSHEELLASASTEATARVFDVLSRLRPAINRYLPLVREWLAAQEKANSEYSALKQAGATLRQSLANPPRGLAVTPLQARLDQAAQMASELGVRVAQPEVEELKALAREVTQLRRVVQDAEQQLARAAKQAGELEQAMDALRTSMAQLSAQCGDLEKRPAFPLVWDESGPVLAGLRKQLEDFGPSSQPRAPEEITRRLKETETIRARYQTLAEKHPRTSEKHKALAALLESSEIKEAPAWLRKSQETMSQIGTYDPKNWSKSDSIATLPAELAAFGQLQQRLGAVDPAAPIHESAAEQRLKTAQELFALRKALGARIESTAARLEKIRVQEKEGKERLTASWAALERVSLLAESNSLLDETASAEIDRLAEEIRQLGNELNAREQGEIEKKSPKITAQTEKVVRAIKSWTDRLNTAISEQGRQVNERLVQLNAIGTIEDAPVQDAKTLLASDAYLSAITEQPSQANSPRAVAARVVTGRLGRGDQKSAQSELEALAELKSRNDLWQSIQAIARALEERCAPALSAYQETMQARNEAQERLKEISAKAPEKRAWPPHNQAGLPESQALKTADEKWDALKKQPVRVETVVLELGRLTQQYRLAGEHAKHLLGRIEQDQERIQELEWQVEDLKQRWQGQAQSDPGNMVIREGVQQLMSQADSRLAFIKHQYMRGALTYEQTIHNLQLLYDELFGARVAVDDRRDIGLNENRPAQGTASRN